VECSDKDILILLIITHNVSTAVAAAISSYDVRVVTSVLSVGGEKADVVSPSVIDIAVIGKRKNNNNNNNKYRPRQ